MVLLPISSGQKWSDSSTPLTASYDRAFFPTQGTTCAEQGFYSTTPDVFSITDDSIGSAKETRYALWTYGTGYPFDALPATTCFPRTSLDTSCDQGESQRNGLQSSPAVSTEKLVFMVPQGHGVQIHPEHTSQQNCPQFSPSAFAEEPTPMISQQYGKQFSPVVQIGEPVSNFTGPEYLGNMLQEGYCPRSASYHPVYTAHQNPPYLATPPNPRSHPYYNRPPEDGFYKCPYADCKYKPEKRKSKYK